MAPIGPDEFLGEAEELLHEAVRGFALWARENWTISEREARTLNKPTEAPAAYARGYNDALASLSDAADLWLEGNL
jgi:hypothetical protein